MILKKIFVVAVLCGTLAAGAFASDNYTLGMDVAGGIVGYGTAKFNTSAYGGDKQISYKEIPFLSLKVNTYDCFLLNNHFGIYGSIGLVPQAMFDVEVDGKSNNDDPWAGIAIEFMVGPAFGVDLGDSGIRFQCGVPFHAEFGAYFYDEKKQDVKTKNTRSYSAFGVGLTPQFRFMANRRCSFIIGADFIFDFAMGFKEERKVDDEKTTRDLNPKSAVRFKVDPYLGLGINFGK